MNDKSKTLKRLLFEQYDQKWSDVNIRYLRLKVALFNKEIKQIRACVRITDAQNEDPFINLLVSYLLSTYLPVSHILIFLTFKLRMQRQPKAPQGLHCLLQALPHTSQGPHLQVNIQEVRRLHQSY